MEVSQKNINRMTLWSRKLTPGHLFRQNYNSKRYRYPYIHHNSKLPRRGRNLNIHQRWMDKKTWYIYTMEYYSAIKNWNNAIFSNMNATKDYHAKWSHKEKDNYHCYHSYVESNMWQKWTYLWNRNGIIDTENRQVVAQEERCSGSWA